MCGTKSCCSALLNINSVSHFFFLFQIHQMLHQEQIYNKARVQFITCQQFIGDVDLSTHLMLSYTHTHLPTYIYQHTCVIPYPCHNALCVNERLELRFYLLFIQIFKFIEFTRFYQPFFELRDVIVHALIALCKVSPHKANQRSYQEPVLWKKKICLS